MDFGMIFKLQGLWMKFTKNHPKFPQFMKAVQSKGLPADTVIDIRLTYPDGAVVDSNLKVSEDDLKLIEELKKMKK